MPYLQRLRQRVGRRAALTLVELLVTVAIIGIVLALTAGAVQKVRAAAARTTCSNNLRQVGIGLHGYHQGHGCLPPGISSNGEKDPLLFMGWGARLLPYIEQGPLWAGAIAAYAQDRDFRNVPPHSGLATPVAVYSCPADSRVRTARPVNVGKGHPLRAFTSYLGVIGVNTFREDGVLYLDSKVRFAEITDGTSNTLAVGERPPSADLVLGWWYAGWGQDKDGDAEMILGVRAKNRGRYGRGCPVGPYPFGPGKFGNQCDAFHFWSPHDGGAFFLLADGSVRFLAYSADSVLPALATRAGGEAVALPE